VYDLLGSIARLTKSTPECVVNRDSRKNIVSKAKEARVNLYRALKGKSRYISLYVAYTFRLQDLQALAKSSKSVPASNNGPSETLTEPNGPVEVDGFHVPIRRKRISLDEQETKKKAGPHTSVEGKAVYIAETKNYFPPLSSTPAMECTETEGGRTGRAADLSFSWKATPL
jgi:hypothetical protein